MIAVRATLFLGTDACVVDNVDDLLDLLNRFEVAARHALGHSTPGYRRSITRPDIRPYTKKP
jgi:hypothetical protein